ncbi:sugar kinase [Deinococcus aerius]|uniref:Sugar kinase n=1 Tax=Deinococcus aerius TaxID=200253 RepID=A0A2I9D6U7_9DEIO|nr:carbohydrate kinase [Deinococcus aerius]GBF06170.1 sugar kinase [Deinococcus aerius]
MTRVLTFGGAVIDFVRSGDHWQARAGGSAWNTARVLVALGQPTAFVGALGDDPFAEGLWTEAEAHGLDLSLIQRVKAHTALSVIHRTHPAQYAFYAENAADSQFSRCPEDAWQGVTAAYFGGITLMRDPARPHFLALARKARERGITVVYDPNYRPQLGDAYREAFPQYVPLADFIKVSEEDLAGLLPHLTLDQALAWVRALNPAATVLLTLGAQGARLIGPGLDLHHPGYRVDVVDTVGAGDASIAGLLYSTLHDPQAPPARHLGFALACAAAACTRPGAHAPTLTEVRSLLQETQA